MKFYVIKFIILVITLVYSYGIRPSELLLNNNAKDIVDLKSFLDTNSPDYEYLKNKIFEIRNKHNLEVKHVIFSKMNTEYKGNIQVFTDEFAYIFFNADMERDHQSLIVSVAVNDRKMRIRTGKNIKNKISDYSAQAILESGELKNFLRDGNYTSASKFILTKLAEKLDDPVSDEISGFIILFLILIYSIYKIYDYFFKGKFVKKSPEERLERIRKICDEKKPKKEFIEKNCIICLEEFENIENQSKENKEKNENIIAKLQCGHSFHSKCISDWMTKKNVCPLCKAKIDNEEDDYNYKNISENLVDVQREYYPELSNYSFSYSQNSFTWTNPRQYVNSNTSTSYEDSNETNNYSNESGGASGSW